MSDFPHIAGRSEQDVPIPSCVCDSIGMDAGDHDSACPFGKWLAEQQERETRPGHVADDTVATAVGEAVGSGPTSGTVHRTQAGCHCEEMLFEEADEFEREATAYERESAAASMFRGHAAYLRSLGERVIHRRNLAEQFRRTTE